MWKNHINYFLFLDGMKTNAIKHNSNATNGLPVALFTGLEVSSWTSPSLGVSSGSSSGSSSGVSSGTSGSSSVSFSFTVPITSTSTPQQFFSIKLQDAYLFPESEINPMED